MPKIQAFVFNWKGHSERAARLEEAITPFADVRVINSEEAAQGAHPGWVHLGESAYFSRQWNELVRLFDADIVLHMQADATVEDFPRLFDRALRAFERWPVGVYEPNVDRNYIVYDRARLRALDEELFEIPVSDCTCWFISGAVLRSLSPIDLRVNSYGWGINATVAAVCRRSGFICVRDDGVSVRHAPGRGYPGHAARQQMLEYINSLPLDLAVDVVRVHIDIEKVRQRP